MKQTRKQELHDAQESLKHAKYELRGAREFVKESQRDVQYWENEVRRLNQQVKVLMDIILESKKKGSKK